MILSTRARTLAACAFAATLILASQIDARSSNAQSATPELTVAQDTTAPPVTETTTPTTAPATATTVPSVVISLPTPTVPTSVTPAPTTQIATPPATGAGGAILLVPETTTTTSETTLPPGESTTSTQTTNASTTSTSSTALPAIGDVGNDDATSETPPPPFIPVLPPSKTIVRNPTLEKLLFKLTAAQKKTVADAQAKADAAQLKVTAAENALQTIKTQIDAVRADQARLVSRLDGLRVQVRDRALRVYAGEQVEVLDQLLRSEDVTALARRIDLVSQAQKNDAALMDDYEAQRHALDGRIAELDVLVAQTQAQIDTFKAEQAVVGEELAKVQQQLSFVNSGMAIALGGFVFPVAGPTVFSDTFGAPRMVGTKYYHLHEGTDVFATQGTPLVATNRGVILRKGVGVLGGNKLWLVAADGTQYYYAHLSAFQDGVDDGTVVEAGQVIGYVGNTGNAVTTPPHVHFEIHPGGGPAIDPFPILDAVRRSDITALLAAGNQATPSTTTSTTIPGEVRAGVGVEREFAVDAATTTTLG